MRGKKAKAIRKFYYGSDRKVRKQRMRDERKYVGKPYYRIRMDFITGKPERYVDQVTVFCADEWRRSYIDAKRMLKDTKKGNRNA